MDLKKHTKTTTEIIIQNPMNPEYHTIELWVSLEGLKKEYQERRSELKRIPTQEEKYQYYNEGYEKCLEDLIEKLVLLEKEKKE